MKTETKKIPISNYIIYTIIVGFTVALTFFLCNWYNVHKDLTQKKTIMSEFLVMVNENDFENYIVENNNIIIYLSSSKDESLIPFEEQLKNLLIRADLTDEMVFIDLDNISNSFLKNLKENYFKNSISNIELNKYPNILIMENGEINSVLYANKTEINIEDVEKFFYNRGVIAQA